MPEGAAPKKGSPAIVAAGSSHTGRRRDHNEDSFLLRPDLNLFVVADGAGGHNAGEIASALVTKSIENFFEATASKADGQPQFDAYGLETQARRLAAAVQKANADVREIARASSARAGMGSTVVVAYVRPEWRRLYLAHVGDSRCYRLRGAHVESLTHDHTMLNDVLELRPDVDDAVIARLPKSVVTRAIGMADRVRVELRAFQLAAGDRYLLCTDGLSRELPEDALHGALRSPEAPNKLAEQLITLANEASGADNITALLLDYDRADADSWPPPPIVITDAARTGRLVRGAPIRPEEASSPEILLLGIESDADVDVSGEVRVVPHDSLGSEVRDAVEDFVAPLRADAPKQAAKPVAKPVTKAPPAKPSSQASVAKQQVVLGIATCRACEGEIPDSSRFCPHCGKPRE